jgi:hypothetical protein
MCPPGARCTARGTPQLSDFEGREAAGPPADIRTRTTALRHWVDDRPLSKAHPILSHLVTGRWTGGRTIFFVWSFFLVPSPLSSDMPAPHRHTRPDTVPDGRQRQKVVLMSRPRCTCPGTQYTCPIMQKRRRMNPGRRRAKKRIRHALRFDVDFNLPSRPSFQQGLPPNQAIIFSDHPGATPLRLRGPPGGRTWRGVQSRKSSSLDRRTPQCP